MRRFIEVWKRGWALFWRLIVIGIITGGPFQVIDRLISNNASTAFLLVKFFILLFILIFVYPVFTLVVADALGLTVTSTSGINEKRYTFAIRIPRFMSGFVRGPSQSRMNALLGRENPVASSESDTSQES